MRTPKLFLEAKALGQGLDDRKWANQIMGYAAVAGVKWTVITNGDEYRIYNACVDVPVEEKLFRLVRLSDPSSPAFETLGLLSKDRIRDNDIEILWKAHFVDRQVRTVLEGLFAPEPDPSLMRLVRKHVRDLSAKDVRASLARVHARFDFPVEPDAPPARPRKPWRSGETAAGAAQTHKTHRMLGVTLSDVIAAGLLKPPLKLTVRYKGQQLEADLLPDGTVNFQGTKYDTCSGAARFARSIVTGRKMSTNGWAFWRYRDQQGNLVPLDAARQAFLKSKTR